MKILISSARRRLQRARTAFQCGDADLVLNECRAVLAADPGNFAARLLTARSLIMKKQDKEADTALRALIADHPKRAQPHRLLAVIAFRRRDVAAGVAHFEAAPGIEAGSVAARLELAVLMRVSYCISSAMETLAELRSAHPDRVDVLIELARCCLILGELEQTVDHCGDALSLEPDNLASRSLMAEVDHRRGRDRDARAWLDPLMSNPDDPPDAVIERAAQLNMLGDHEAALGEWERARVLAPDSMRVTCDLAGTLLIRDALDRAAEIVQDATRQGPPLPWPVAAAVELSKGYRRHGDKAKARTWEKRAAALKSSTWQERAEAVLGQAGQRLNEIRATPAATRIRENAPDRVTLMCPIHRPDDLDNALLQLGRQTYPNTEVVIALHRMEIGAADVESRWSSPRPLRIVRCEDEEYISQVQMTCLAASEGDIVVEIDADDIYLPNYTTDMVTTMAHFGADVLGKRGHFRYYEASDGLYLHSPHSVLCPADRPGTGPTICARRDVANAVGFDARYKHGQDLDFYRRAIVGGYRVFHGDPFNHVVMRRTDTAIHTWQKSDIQGISADTIYFGDRDAFQRVEA